jgi:hypothetical protein
MKKNSLSLVHSARSPVSEVNGSPKLPRIGVLRPRAAPPTAKRNFSVAENRNFVALVRKQSQSFRWCLKYALVPLPDLAEFPQLIELLEMADWHASKRPAWSRHTLDRNQPDDFVIRVSGNFDYRGDAWLWRIIEKNAPLGLLVEVFGPMRAYTPMAARKRWEVHRAAA